MYFDALVCYAYTLLYLRPSRNQLLYVLEMGFRYRIIIWKALGKCHNKKNVASPKHQEENVSQQKPQSYELKINEKPPLSSPIEVVDPLDVTFKYKMSHTFNNNCSIWVNPFIQDI